MEGFVAGRPRLAKVLDSEDNHCMHRKYGPWISRVLVRKEVELFHLTKELQALDEEDELDPGMRYRLQTVEHYEEWDQKQRQLEDKFEARWISYGKEKGHP